MKRLNFDNYQHFFCVCFRVLLVVLASQVLMVWQGHLVLC